MVRKTARISPSEKIEVMRLKCEICGCLEKHGSFVCDHCVSEAKRVYKESLKGLKSNE
jgi:hypothetical protein